jgi:hypothetical protein
MAVSDERVRNERVRKRTAIRGFESVVDDG